MSTASSPFKFVSKDLGNANTLCIIDIEDITPELKKCIDERLVKICEGNSSSDINYVKTRLIKFLTSKKGSDIEMGAIAEFFIHLYLNEVGYAPQFLFFNLEENSIKKGFDGFYLLAEDEWILESKSGHITTRGITHAKKIKESYTDLKGKLVGGGTNNPWQNAYSHASHFDVGASRTLAEKIKKFSREYEDKNYKTAKDMNIIPSATIFLDGNWKNPSYSDIETEVKAAISTFEFKKINVVCLTKKSIDLFWNYLNS